jgi:hypothetical protein
MDVTAAAHDGEPPLFWAGQMLGRTATAAIVAALREETGRRCEVDDFREILVEIRRKLRKLVLGLLPLSPAPPTTICRSVRRSPRTELVDPTEDQGRVDPSESGKPFDTSDLDWGDIWRFFPDDWE